MRVGRTWIYYVNIDSGQILLGNNTVNISLAMVDSVMTQGIIGQIVSKLEHVPLKEVILYVILASLAGLGGGYTLGAHFGI